jgi:hypothetical protein
MYDMIKLMLLLSEKFHYGANATWTGRFGVEMSKIWIYLGFWNYFYTKIISLDFIFYKSILWTAGTILPNTKGLTE